MIPMSCPSCGRRGTVPPDRLNTRMHCKKCDAVFYMDSGGRITLGEPPATKKGRKGSEPEDPFDVFGKLGKLPKGIWYTLGVLIVGYIGYNLVGWIWSGLAGGGLPDNVETLSKYVGEAFADGRIKDLRGVAVPGTEDNVEKWFKDNRKYFGDFGKQGPGNDVVVNVDIETQAQDSANVKAMLLPPQENDEKGNPQPSLTLKLPWIKADGHWRLDGTQALTLGVQQNR
jgi:hypothetical protein